MSEGLKILIIVGGTLIAGSFYIALVFLISELMLKIQEWLDKKRGNRKGTYE